MHFKYHRYRRLDPCSPEANTTLWLFLLRQVAAGLSALALHSSVLKLFPPSGVLGPFLQLSLDGLIPRETCFSALLDTPVTAYR